MAEETQHQILVIGGGIAGITATLDLENKGFTVYLVEKSPSIGGHMAQLDKTFPTLDCSICILAPKMVEVAQHGNIRVLTYSEVTEVQRLGEGKGFLVKIVRKPRYVDESACKGCRECIEKCPARVPSEFEVGIGERKAIYIPFPQSVPAVATIDKEHCLYFTKGICRVCEKVCPADAIDFNQVPEEVELEVSSIVVATGYDLLDPLLLPQYGYGKFKDVLYSLQYERLVNAAGPTGGKIIRPSNGEPPKTIVFIQCVGSRSEKEDEKQYCSQICCMYATKHSIVTKEHEPDAEVYVLYNDLNTAGKGYEEFFNRTTEEYGIKYVKGLPGEVQRDPDSGKFLLRYVDMGSNGEMKHIPADLIVLCPAVVPQGDVAKLAKALRVETDEYGFFKSADETLDVKTSVPGIFMCGACQGPKDISHSVMQAHAAAGEATSFARRPPHVEREMEYVEAPTDVSEPRIGVFVCHCGFNIARVVDVGEVVEYARALPYVTHAEDLLFSCSKDSTERIKEVIVEEKLNRVVVAACTPRTHEPLFSSVCREAGLNPYLFEMVNIREHASWVHPKQPEEATEKAKNLVRSGVAKAMLLTPLRELKVKVYPSTLVVGGSLAGLVAAKLIADVGFKVYLVSGTDELGGRFLNEYPEVPFIEADIRSRIEELVSAVKEIENIEVLQCSEVTEFKGSVGDFDVRIVDKNGLDRDLKVGTAIIAEDNVELKPKGLYGYGELEGVYTVSELFDIIQCGGAKDGEVVAFILCAGAREKRGRTYCSVTCCSEALNSALSVKELNPNSEVYMIYRDIRLPLIGEAFYNRAHELGIKFLRYGPEEEPKVYQEGVEKFVEVFDTIINMNVKLRVDKVALAVPVMAPEKNHELSSIFKVPLNEHGFFLEAHPKLRPLDFASDGLFICGPAHSPQGLHESMTQGLGAASRALSLLMQEEVLVEPLYAEVDEELCVGCGTCVSLCEYNAVKIVERASDRLVSEVNPAQCKGCGVCAAQCPSRAITMNKFTGGQMVSAIKAALLDLDPSRLKVLCFFCNWCAYAGADMAGVSRYQYPPMFEIIRAMCTGRIDPLWILYALTLGADGVVVGGCHPGDCHYISGNIKAEEMLNRVRDMLKLTKIEPERVLDLWVSAGEGKILAEELDKFAEKLTALGPNPYRRS